MTHISLQHVVMFFFCAETFLEDGNVSLVVLVLLLQCLHLGARGQQFLVPLADLSTQLFNLHDTSRSTDRPIYTQNTNTFRLAKKTKKNKENLVLFWTPANDFHHRKLLINANL